MILNFVPIGITGTARSMLITSLAKFDGALWSKRNMSETTPGAEHQSDAELQASSSFVSIVIPHRGSDFALESCLSAIRAQDYPKEFMETFVVLNESNNRELSFKLRPGEKLLWEPREGSYAARNYGIRVARGDVIALTDSDTEPGPSWISAGVTCLSQGAQLVAGAIQVTHSTPPNSSALYEKLFAFDQEKNAGFGQSVTANLLVKREVFTTYGLFDENAKSGEDFEWTRSATSQGAAMVFCKDALVRHPARESWVELVKKAYRTAWQFPSGATGHETSLRLKKRIRQKLLHGPSISKKQAMRGHQRLVAHTVRAALMAFQASLLLILFAKGGLRRLVSKARAQES